MTTKLYYQDSHMKAFTATVLSCTPIEKQPGKFQIELDATAFFPEGGGQFADTGILKTDDGTVIPVLDVREKQDTITHITESPINPGVIVSGEINWAQRFDRMQQHSGEHILSGLVNAHYGFDNVGFHLGNEETTLDFNGFLSKEQLEELEWKANLAITENFQVKVSYPTKEELSQMIYRSKIEIAGQVRIVEYPCYDICACCAPHVDRTGEIGMIKIVRSQAHRGGVRVTILCGLRALRDYRQKDTTVKTISVLLSANEAKVSEAVTRVHEEAAALRGEVAAFQRQRLQVELERIPAGDQNVSVILEDMSANTVRDFVNELMKKCTGICSAFFGSDETGYKYIIGSANTDVRAFGKEVNAKLSGRGGGKPEMIQGSVQACKAQINEYLNNGAD